jgi:hypothetical protein
MPMQAQRKGGGTAPTHSQRRPKKGEGVGRTVTDTNVMLGVIQEHMLAAKNFRIFSVPSSVYKSDCLNT